MRHMSSRCFAGPFRGRINDRNDWHHAWSPRASFDGGLSHLSRYFQGDAVKIGDVAKRLDIPSSTIRYYEKKGLINPPKRVSGKREFSTSALVTLRFIQLCQAAGFTIVEIRSLLEHYAEDSSKSGLWQPAVETKRTEIRKQIDELKQVDAVLGELMKCRCESIEQCVSLALQDSRWILGDSE